MWSLTDCVCDVQCYDWYISMTAGIRELSCYFKNYYFAVCLVSNPQLNLTYQKEDEYVRCKVNVVLLDWGWPHACLHAVYYIWQPSWLVWPELKAWKLHSQLTVCCCSRRGGASGDRGQPRVFSLRHLPDLHLPPLRVPQDAHRDVEVGGADPGPLHPVHPHLIRQARVSTIFHWEHFQNNS